MINLEKLEKNLSVGNKAVIEGWTVTKNSDGIYKIKMNKYKKNFF